MVAFVNRQPLFSLGQVVATPAAVEALERADQPPSDFLTRHVRGDWGEGCEADKALNDQAVRDGSRILSTYRTKLDVKLWVITEAVSDGGSREATTILLPDEY